jgi:hypothetical protein
MASRQPLPPNTQTSIRNCPDSWHDPFNRPQFEIVRILGMTPSIDPGPIFLRTELFETDVSGGCGIPGGRANAMFFRFLLAYSPVVP